MRSSVLLIALAILVVPALGACRKAAIDGGHQQTPPDNDPRDFSTAAQGQPPAQTVAQDDNPKDFTTKDRRAAPGGKKSDEIKR